MKVWFSDAATADWGTGPGVDCYSPRVARWILRNLHRRRGRAAHAFFRLIQR